MQVQPRPRPSGEAARVVTKEYDVPLDPDVGLPANSAATTVATGRSARLRHDPRLGLHDGGMDLDGNLWFTCEHPEQAHHDRQDRHEDRRGEVLKVAAPDGFAAQAHGMTRDDQGQ